MQDRYLPPSDFLNAVINEDVPLVGGEHCNENLQRLIEMTRDENVVNRDWATLLLAQLELDEPDVRSALLAAAQDKDANVRAEAILGLAQLERTLALPFLRYELAGQAVSMPILEAAAIVADSSLIGGLEAFATPSGNDFLDGFALRALMACKAAVV